MSSEPTALPNGSVFKTDSTAGVVTRLESKVLTLQSIQNVLPSGSDFKTDSTVGVVTRLESKVLTLQSIFGT